MKKKTIIIITIAILLIIFLEMQVKAAMASYIDADGNRREIFWAVAPEDDYTVMLRKIVVVLNVVTILSSIILIVLGIIKKSKILAIGGIVPSACAQMENMVTGGICNETTEIICRIIGFIIMISTIIYYYIIKNRKEKENVRDDKTNN